MELLGQTPEGERLERIVSAAGEPGGMIRLTGRIARAVRGAAGTAGAIEESTAWDEWFDDGGFLGLLGKLATRANVAEGLDDDEDHE